MAQRFHQRSVVSDGHVIVPRMLMRRTQQRKIKALRRLNGSQPFTGQGGGHPSVLHQLYGVRDGQGRNNRLRSARNSSQTRRARAGLIKGLAPS